MLNPNQLQQIKKTIEEFFEKIGEDVEVQVLPQQDQVIPVKAVAQEAHFLIGEKGRTLLEIQRLLTAIAKRAVRENFYLDFDINDYKKKKTNYLKEISQSIADEVSLIKKEKYLPPMPSPDRKIIHLELASRDDVVTESIGQEPKRRVVVRPNSQSSIIDN